MPTYSYQCPNCGAQFDRILRLIDYDLPQNCSCGAPAEKVICAPAIRADYAGYNCPVTGNWIEGKRAHEENLRRHGCRVLEPGEVEASRRSLADSEAALEKSIDSAADQFIAGLPAAKRDRLAGEMEGGITATVERQ